MFGVFFILAVLWGLTLHEHVFTAANLLLLAALVAAIKWIVDGYLSSK